MNCPECGQVECMGNTCGECGNLCFPEPDIYDAVAELRARKDEPSPKFTVCVSVGGKVQFFDLTRAEIEETWRTVQASVLPQTFIGWYDEKSKWTQLGTKPAKF